MKNIFITGLLGCGKTTLIMEILKELKLDAGGFYTSEIREGGIRKGFKMTTLDVREGTLAYVNIKSPYKISKYKVNLKDIEEIKAARKRMYTIGGGLLFLAAIGVGIYFWRRKRRAERAGRFQRLREKSSILNT